MTVSMHSKAVLAVVGDGTVHQIPHNSDDWQHQVTVVPADKTFVATEGFVIYGHRQPVGGVLDITDTAKRETITTVSMDGVTVPQLTVAFTGWYDALSVGATLNASATYDVISRGAPYAR